MSCKKSFNQINGLENPLRHLSRRVEMFEDLLIRYRAAEDGEIGDL